MQVFYFDNITDCQKHNSNVQGTRNVGPLPELPHQPTSGYMGKYSRVMRSTGVAPEVDLGDCTYTFTSTKKVNKAEPTLALKPRGDITRNPKQGYQWPQNRTHVSAKNCLKKVHESVRRFKLNQ